MASHRNARVLAAVGCLLALVLSTGAIAEGLKGTYRDAGPPGRVDRGVWISAFDHQEDSYYALSGITVAFNGNIDRDGLALRVMGLYEHFDLDPGSGRTWQGDVMLGYIFNRKGYYGGIFAGLDVQRVRLRPDDPTADVRGTETGFKVAGHVVSDRSLPHYFNLYGHYSTAFESYYLRTRVGLSRNRVAFGPEYILSGDEDDRTQRLGGFLTFDLKLDRPVEVTLNAGYQWADDSGAGAGFGRGGGDGAYGGIMVIVPF